MILYLAIFSIFVVFSIGCSRGTKSLKTVSFFTLYLVYIFIFSFRASTVGTDTLTYIENFYDSYLHYPFKMEFLFLFANNFFNMLGLPYSLFFLFISSLIFILFTKSFEQRYLYIIYPLLYIVALIPSFNIQRQILGLSFAFYAIKLNNNKSFVYLILGSLFHKSIFLYLLVFFISRFFHPKQYFFYFVIIIVLILMLSNKLMDILIFFLNFTPYSEYQWMLFENLDLSISIISYVKIALFFRFYYFSKKIENSNFRTLNNILIFFLILGEIAVKMNSIFFRLQVLFSPVQILEVSQILKVIKVENKLIDKFYLFILLSYIFITFYLNLKAGVNQIIPYDLVNLYEL